MKSFKKALAVLLSVLMVVFSFPMSALAVVNENNPDGIFSTDYDVEVNVAVMDYTDRNEWGYDAGDLLITGDGVKSISKADLANPDGIFALVFYISNLDSLSAYNLTWEFDPEVVTNCYIDRRETVTGPDAGADSVLATFEDFPPETGSVLDGYSSGNFRGKNQIYVAGVLTNGEVYTDCDLSYGDAPEDFTVHGMVVGVIGMQLLSDEPVDLTQAIKPRMTTTEQQIGTIYAEEFSKIFLYGVNWSTQGMLPDGTYTNIGDPQKEYTMYSMPQWGLGVDEPEEPENVTYTYTFADEHTEQVTAPAGEAPQAPANTADSACVSNSDGTHTYNKYSWPAWEDGTTEYTEIATPTTEACDMQETTPATPPVHEDGQLIDGTSAVMTCSKCGYQTGGETIPAGEHDYQLSEELSTAATCVAKGENVYVCSVCGDTMTEETEIDPNNHANVVTDAAVAATCTATGLTEGSHCEACSTVIVEQEEIPALGHDYQITETTGATCVTAGKVTYTCSRCDDTYTEEGALDPNNHEGDVALDPETVKEATRGEDGYTGDTVCSACGAVVTPGEVIPALGVMITVEQNELGSTTLNSAPTTGEAQKVPYEEEYTLVATPAEDAEFVGWSVNGKLISTDATYTTAAYADLTYVPVFAEQTDDFTVTFVDQFNMVLDTVTSSELASLEAMPETYDYLGYTFANWSMSLEEVKALEANAVVTAYYAKDAELTYTVSAPGCVITVGDSTYNDTAEVGFDQAVTVAPAEGTATAWTVNGNNAAYGAEYTFYVTSDVEVAFTSGEVTAVPTVAAVDVTPTESGEVRFLATRNVPAGYTVLESGFVYGKDFAAPETDLVLENATTGSCYLYKNSNTAGDGQFALTFGITAQTGVAYARAYVIAADAEGNAAVYYADVQSYDYDA